MIRIIAAVSLNGIIGKNGQLPWNYPKDKKFFRDMTMGSSVIMGRKTYESMGSNPLEGRQTFVISSNNNLEHESKITVYNHMHQAAADFDYKKSPSAWLCGGARVYEEGMVYASEIWLTTVSYTHLR